jgi:hypothetical protein
MPHAEVSDTRLLQVNKLTIPRHRRTFHRLDILKSSSGSIAKWPAKSRSAIGTGSLKAPQREQTARVLANIAKVLTKPGTDPNEGILFKPETPPK